MLQFAVGSGTVWLVLWLLIAGISASHNMIALYIVFFEKGTAKSFSYCLKSLFSSHLISALVVLPMLSTITITKISPCIHVPILTYMAAMTHFASTISVLGISANLFLRIRSKTVFETSTTTRRWIKFVVLSWFLSLCAGLLPLFLPAYLFAMPVLVILMIGSTYNQIRALGAIARRKIVVSSIAKRHRPYEKKIITTVIIFLCINLVFTIIPYSAFILAKSHNNGGRSLSIYLSIASKLPFFKGLAECIVYCWMQRTFRRSMTTKLNRIFVKSDE